MFSILHISDLHRSADDPISNDELVASLSTDRARYARSDPAIKAPDAIVISGDIIQGVLLGDSAGKHSLSEQYSVAESFLGRLADEFVHGDRSKVIVAPGNHDVDWNVAREAMEIVAPEYEPKPASVFSVDSDYRWSWKDRRFYKIIDQVKYAQRLDAYWEFVERFYAGVNGGPNLNSEKQFALFPLWEGRIGVAVFNSCRGNDCFAYHGAIEPSAIAVAREVMHRDHQFGLWVAVWHHSIEGAPYRSDYMDTDQVRNMVGYGFRLGLHGHQHRHQVLPMHVDLPDRETMAVVSAGSLCAGPKELPTGFFRQYNIIEVSDDLKTARVHVRQMETAHLFSGCHMTSVGGKTFHDISWSDSVLAAPAHTKAGEPPAKVVIDAEHALRTGDPALASQILSEWMPSLRGFARSIFVRACVEASEWEVLIARLGAPQSIEELTALIEACDHQRLIPMGLEALQTHADSVSMPAAQRLDLERRLKIRGETSA